MLQLFRNKAQSIFIQAIVLIIALVFVFWGVGSNLMDKREAALLVNGEEVSFQEFQRVYEQAVGNYREQFGGSIPSGLLEALGIKEQVINQLSQAALLRQGAADMGLVVSAREVQQAIEQMVQFQSNGGFDLERYKSILSANRLTPSKYEASMRYDLLSDKAISSIAAFAAPGSEQAIRDLHQMDKERLRLEYVTFAPADYRDQVEINDEGLAAWYAQQQADYQTPVQVKLRSLLFDEAPEQNLDAFASANSAYEAIITAGSLDAYAQTQPQAQIKGSDFFSRSSPPADLRDPVLLQAAFALGEGELSSIIKTNSGYAILFAEAIRQPTTPPLNEVIEQVRSDYRDHLARELAREAAAELLTTSRSDQDQWQAQITASGLNLQQSPAISRREPAQDLPRALQDQAFRLGPANPLPEEVVEEGGLYYAFRFLERSLPEPGELSAEERSAYQQQLLNRSQNQLLGAWVSRQRQAAEISISANL